MNVPPDRLPIRAAERLGRLFVWADQLDVTRQERAVLMHLIAVGNEHLHSTWSAEATGAKIGYGERVVRESLKSLRRKGLISRRPRKHADGTRTSDLVTILPPPDLLRKRTSEAELRAELEAEAYQEAIADYGSPIGPAISAAPMNNGAAEPTGRSLHPPVEITEEPLGLYRDTSTDLKVPRQILPVGSKSRFARRQSEPKQIAAAIKVAADIERMREAG